MLSEIEKQVLKKISEDHLVSKTELKKFVEAIAKDSSSADSIARRLMEKRYLISLSPVGSTSYAITQLGSQMLREA